MPQRAVRARLSRWSEGDGRDRLWLAIVVIVAAAVRIAWVLYAAKEPQNLGDPFSYLSHAADIADGKGYRIPFSDTATAYYPVGYPAILGAAYWVGRGIASSATAFATAVWLNVAAGVATVALVHILGTRLADRRVGLIAAGLVAIWPNLVFYTATAYLETVFTLLVIAALTAILGRPWPPSGIPLARLITFALLLAAATMVRPIALGLIPVMFLGWLRARMGSRRALTQVGVVVGVVVVVALPWSVRSTAAMNGLVILSTNNGDNLCIGHQPESTGRYHDLFEFCWPPYEDEPIETREVRRDRGNAGRAFRYAVSHPAREAELLVSKTYHLLRHDHEGLLAVEEYGGQAFIPDGRQNLLRIGADVFWFVVGALTLLGLPAALRQGDSRRRILMAATLALLVLPLVFFGGARFHVPAAPLLAIVASLPLAALMSRAPVLGQARSHPVSTATRRGRDRGAG